MVFQPYSSEPFRTVLSYIKKYLDHPVIHLFLLELISARLGNFNNESVLRCSNIKFLLVLVCIPLSQPCTHACMHYFPFHINAEISRVAGILSPAPAGESRQHSILFCTG